MLPSLSSDRFSRKNIHFLFLFAFLVPYPATLLHLCFYSDRHALSYLIIYILRQNAQQHTVFRSFHSRHALFTTQIIRLPSHIIFHVAQFNSRTKRKNRGLTVILSAARRIIPGWWESTRECVGADGFIPVSVFGWACRSAPQRLRARHQSRCRRVWAALPCGGAAGEMVLRRCFCVRRRPIPRRSGRMLLIPWVINTAETRMPPVSLLLPPLVWLWLLISARLRRWSALTGSLAHR